MAKVREGRYPARVTVALSTATSERVRAASDLYGVAEAVIVRRAIDNGLARAIESIRKQREEVAGLRGARKERALRQMDD